MLAQQGKTLLDPEMRRATFDGPEGQRALQTLVDFLQRDRIDSLQAPALPGGVEPLATDAVAGTWARSDIFPRIERAGLRPLDVLVGDLTPSFSPGPTPWPTSAAPGSW